MEKIKIERSKSIGFGTLEQLETSTILHCEILETKLNPMKEVELGLVHSGSEITKVVWTESNIGEFSNTELTEPDVEEPSLIFMNMNHLWLF